MADLKISQLSAATALAGTEVVPVVQGGSTKKATIDQILTPAAGKGLDFSANTGAPGMTSELFDWYEEGTFTPILRDNPSGNAATASTSIGRYTRIGRIVNFNVVLVNVNTSGLTAGNNVYVTGLPYTSANPNANNAVPITVLAASTTSTTGCILALIQPNTSELQFFNSTTAGLTGFLVSALSSGASDFYISGYYETA